MKSIGNAGLILMFCLQGSPPQFRVFSFLNGGVAADWTLLVYGLDVAGADQVV
jgi:hypothetical protein